MGETERALGENWRKVFFNILKTKIPVARNHIVYIHSCANQHLSSLPINYKFLQPKSQKYLRRRVQGVASHIGTGTVPEIFWLRRVFHIFLTGLPCQQLSFSRNISPIVKRRPRELIVYCGCSPN